MEYVTHQQCMKAFARLQRELLCDTTLRYSRLGMAASRYYFDSLRYTTPVSLTLQGNNARSMAELLGSPRKAAVIKKYIARMRRRDCPANTRVALSCRYGKVNQFPPLLAGQLLKRAGGRRVLDPCAGWGDRLMGAAAADMHSYTGIDSNLDLREAYACMCQHIKQETNMQITMMYAPAETVDFSKMSYDIILTCPPYYRKELYAHMPKYTDIAMYMQEFLIPVFKKAYQYLQVNGTMILILQKSVGDVLFDALQVPFTSEVLPCTGKKSIFNNNAGTEFIYTCKK